MLVFALVLFFSSGFAALLYQVIWQRALAYFSGADVYAITIIVSAFMAGLGCGSLAGGHLADRLSARARIVAFAAAEIAIAAFAVASLPLYSDFLPSRAASFPDSPVLLASVLFAALLWPTFFMGMSLPLLAKTLTTSVKESGRMIGSLYGINTLGAATGAFITTWFLMRRYGFETTVALGATLNALAGLGALFLIPSLRRRKVEPDAPASAVHALPERPLPTGLWILIYGVSGFVALSLEIVWFRLLGVIAKPTAFLFGHLLALFLAGLAAGTFAGIRISNRTLRPRRTFLTLQASICAYAGLSVLVLMMLLSTGTLAVASSYVAQYDPLDISAVFAAIGKLADGTMVDGDTKYLLLQFALVYVFIPLVVIGPPTLMMGMSFPLLQRAVQSDLALLGRRVGWLQAANIAGSMVGAILTGWLGLELFGASGMLRALVVSGILFAAILFSGTSRWRVAPAAAALVLIAAALPSAASLWSTVHGATTETTIVAEDATGVSVLRGSDPAFTGETTVFVNGLGQSEIPFARWHIALGLVPVFLHPAPQDIALIGLGSGATLFGASGREETRSLTSIEIIDPQLETLRRLDERSHDSSLRTVLTDTRTRFHTADGRRFIAAGAKYDIIEADALRPSSAYSGNLYSIEYFQLIRGHLKPGGFAVSWAPTRRIINSFVKVFPWTLHYADESIAMVIGSDRPFVWDSAAIATRLSSDFAERHYGSERISSYRDAIARSKRTYYGPQVDRGAISDFNSDLFPRDEFLVRQPEALPGYPSFMSGGIARR